MKADMHTYIHKVGNSYPYYVFTITDIIIIARIT